MAITGLTFIIYSFPMNDSILRIIPSIASFLYRTIVALVLASAFVFTIYRFYKNLVTNEGYLMFTLPVKVNKLVQAKLLTAVATQTLSFGLYLFSMLIVSRAKYSQFQITGLSVEIERFRKLLDVSMPLLFVIIIVLIILVLLLYNLTFYASIAIGHTLAKNKFIGSVLGYLIIYGSGQILGTVILILLYFLSDGDISQYVMGTVTIGTLIACSGVLYHITNKYLTNKLNLE